MFQECFHSLAEDTNNTSFDTAIIIKKRKASKKYLIGIKTIAYNSNMQKIAQFKSNHDDWTDIHNQIRKNVKPKMSKEEIDKANHKLYHKWAVEIATLRNKRIDESKKNIKLFTIDDDEDVECVYLTLMPSGKEPCIYVGETSYDRIDIQNITILGCTSKGNPTNFEFTDRLHKYKYTSADSQLYMDFENKKIVIEKWPVKYDPNPCSSFLKRMCA